MSRVGLSFRFVCLLAVLLLASLLQSRGEPASMISCENLASDPAAGLAGNSSISNLKVKLYAEGEKNSISMPPLPTGTKVPTWMKEDTRHAAYCNVQFTYSSRGGRKDGYAAGQQQHIRIVIGLPLNSLDGGKGGKVNGGWNGKIENLGGGGCNGNIRNPLAATDDGYVGSFTDSGHTDEENGKGRDGRCNFGVIQDSHELNTGMIEDFAYEAVHQQVEWAKTLSSAYYGMRAKRNYWNGCSEGGRQGLAMAQKYGDEFDGILAGSPAIYWEEFHLADAWPALVVKDRLTAKGKTLSGSQYDAASKAAVAACDVSGLDTVKDGLVSDTRACTFSAKANICGVKGAPSAPDCLDSDQANAIDEIWAGPTNEYGKRIWYGFNSTIKQVVGGPMGGGAGAQPPGGGGNSQPSGDVNPLPSSTAQAMSYAHRDLTISTNLLYVDKAAIKAAGNPEGAITYAEEAALEAKVVGNLMETQDVDLSKAKSHGTKIIMWHGTEDNGIRWTQSLDYYRRVAAYFGGGKADFNNLQSWFRYYAAPGVSHCGGGEGPAPDTIFDDLVKWVEEDKAPDSVLANGGSLNEKRTRPLCAWPKTAVYKGSGSTDDAANFTCEGNLDANPKAVCSMLRTGFGHETENTLDAKDKGIDAGECK